MGHVNVWWNRISNNKITKQIIYLFIYFAKISNIGAVNDIKCNLINVSSPFRYYKNKDISEDTKPGKS